MSDLHHPPRVAPLLALTSVAGCAWLTTLAAGLTGRSSTPAPTDPQADAPPPGVVAATRENVFTSPGAPRCLPTIQQGPSARQRCAALASPAVHVYCRVACVREHLPGEASRAGAGGLVAVRYVLGAEGRFVQADSLNDPGCGMARAAPDALRVCCDVVREVGDLTPLAGVEGCYVIEFTSAR